MLLQYAMYNAYINFITTRYIYIYMCVCVTLPKLM